LGLKALIEIGIINPFGNTVEGRKERYLKKHNVNTMRLGCFPDNFKVI
jgi:hypothetical protein